MRAVWVQRHSVDGLHTSLVKTRGLNSSYNVLLINVDLGIELLKAGPFNLGSVIPLEYDLHALVLPLVVATITARMQHILVTPVQCVGIAVLLVQKDLEELDHALLGAHMHVGVQRGLVDDPTGVELPAHLAVLAVDLQTLPFVAQVGVLLQLGEWRTHWL